MFPMREFLDVDPAELFLPTGIRSQGADPAKLARQIAKYGDSLKGMPPLELIRGRDGKLRIFDGVTRATRAVMLRPGVKVPAEVTENWPRLDVTNTPRVGDCLP
jgi:hypothetical protein